MTINQIFITYQIYILINDEKLKGENVIVITNLTYQKVINSIFQR